MTTTPPCPHCQNSMRTLADLDIHLRFRCPVLVERRAVGPDFTPAGERRSPVRPTDEEFAANPAPWLYALPA